MKKNYLSSIVSTFLLILIFGAATSFAQTTEFSYQGFFTDNNASANGNFDFEFRLFENQNGGIALATNARPAVPVTNGVFNVVLDFGVFPAANRFLEIGVRPAGGGAFITLAPRSKILSTPFSTNAISATSATSATNATNATTANNALQLGGVNASQFVQTNDARLSDSRNPLPNSTNYIQNRTTQQTSTNFNIQGDGTVGGTLTGNVVSTNTQFNFGSGRLIGKSNANNLFFGILAGQANGGNRNTIVGDAAGQDNASGEENTFLGFVAGQRTTTGGFNTFVGSRAGNQNTTNSTSTFIGYTSGGTNNLTNATAIGARAFVEQSNALILGSIDGVNGATAMTDVGIGVTQPARRLDVNGIIRVGSTTGTIGCVEDRDGTVIAGTCASDLRFKKNVTPFGSVLSSFSKLRPVNYFWRADEFADQRFGNKQSFGLIAQEVETLFPDLVSTDEKGFKAINYSKLPLLTIQAVKELKAENDSLKEQLLNQQRQLDELKKFVYRPTAKKAVARKKTNRR